MVGRQSYCNNVERVCVLWGQDQQERERDDIGVSGGTGVIERDHTKEVRRLEEREREG